MAQRLQGVIPPVITPLRSGRVDLSAVNSVLEHLVRGGVDAIFLLGSCGEGASLPESERCALVAHARTRVGGSLPLLVGIGEVSTARAIIAAKAAEESGADFLVVTPPQYFVPPGDAATVRHFELVAEATALPVVAYNIPHLTHNPLTPTALQEIARLPQVVALKESSGEWECFEALMAAGHSAGLDVLQGAETMILRSLTAGADGAVPGIANVAPALVTGLVRAVRSGDLASASLLQERVDQLCELFQCGYWLCALKQAVSDLGFCEPDAGEPLGPLTPQEHERVRSIVERELKNRQNFGENP